ncbi:hypothetical protein ADK75_07390 [Streptomyces virginiae]|uniref:Uncharacterized protein n=1 Tax=Streptomyces virginiae TaxID=1961 RepID=A0A0L8N1P6_STRVG|nr:hypothetical protein ADK75_07390 [Streptomyces virginiae]
MLSMERRRRGKGIHSSWSSVRRVVAGRVTAAVFGVIWMTSERRLISGFHRSRGLVDWVFFRCWCGKSVNAVRFFSAPSGISLALGSWPPSVSVTVSR